MKPIRTRVVKKRVKPRDPLIPKVLIPIQEESFELPEQVEIQVIRRSSRIHNESERNYGFLLTQDGDVILTDNDKPLIYQVATNHGDGVGDETARRQGNKSRPRRVVGPAGFAGAADDSLSNI
ncbi:hypothetical protein AgCh_037990 [Apium graveolens]